MTFNERTSNGGYQCGEVTSAMQKCIRRGMERDALHWATELDLSGFGEYVWKRLRIIASEDVGMADPSIAILVRSLYSNWCDQRKKADTKHAPERLFLVHAVIALCRTEKSRIVDEALIVFYEGNRQKLLIPDFALDRHTSRGRARKRGWSHFWNEGAKVKKADTTPSYSAEAKAIRVDEQLDLGC